LALVLKRPDKSHGRPGRYRAGRYASMFVKVTHLYGFSVVFYCLIRCVQLSLHVSQICVCLCKLNAKLVSLACPVHYMVVSVQFSPACSPQKASNQEFGRS
jgi:hypothetical protein